MDKSIDSNYIKNPKNDRYVRKDSKIGNKLMLEREQDLQRKLARLKNSESNQLGYQIGYQLGHRLPN